MIDYTAMNASYRYFPVSSAQQAWGLYVTCAGHHTIQPGATFPPTGHPDEYYFTWEKGRTLPEWQLTLLENGAGEIEFAHTRATLAAGSLIVLPPGVWHRYRPNARTGWTTDWIGFGGDLADRLVGGAGFDPRGDVRPLGDADGVRQAFASTVADLLTSAMRTPFAAAACVPGLVAALVEAPNARDGGVHAILKAQTHIAEHPGEAIDFEALAHSLGLSYRSFRYLFRKEVGLSPLQYQLGRRLVRAKNLLASSDMPVKEIAESLGFGTTWYFSHFFRRHTHLSPAAYRKSSASGISSSRTRSRPRNS